MFFRDPSKRAKFIFNAIAPIYGAVHHSVVSGYQKSAKVVHEKIDVTNKSILDLGTGTGAWAAALHHKGAPKVHGVDFAQYMLHKAQKRYPNQIYFSEGDAEELKGFDDKSFDVVTASLMLHGVTADHREKILREMKRVARKHVVVHDFSGKTPPFVRFLEYLEKSDYVNFKANFCNELRQHFSNVHKQDVKYGIALYFAEIPNN